MAKHQSLIVVDDDKAMREMLATLFRKEGYVVQDVASADEALERVREVEFDLVLSDIKMPGKSGIQMVGELRTIRPETPVVLMTAFGSIDSAVEAMQAGALDYITKPFEPEAVLLTLERALERRALEEENRRLRRAVDRTSQFGELIGASPAMREIFALVRRVAGNRSNILISGESGTGKEVVARTIHFHGNRAEKPFVPINCSAIPEGLLESELFGHVRGAFTGAHASKRGLFVDAQGGTLFLDEIGDMPASLQGKLLRALQDRQIRPVGGNKAVPVDVRIIAATNQKLREAMDQGRFREDLYYRLNVIPIDIPPLRERPEDIPPLVQAFIERHSENGRSVSPAAMQRLVSGEWKGNARELENTIERALALSDAKEIQPEDLPLDLLCGYEVSASSARALIHSAARRRLCLREMEDLYIEEILESTGGNKVQAAKILGIDRKTLYRRAERTAAAAAGARG